MSVNQLRCLLITPLLSSPRILVTNLAGQTSPLKGLLGAADQLRDGCHLGGDCRTGKRHWTVIEVASFFDHRVAVTAVDFLRGSDGTFIHRVRLQIGVGWKYGIGGGASFGVDRGFSYVGWGLRYGGYGDGDRRGRRLVAVDCSRWERHSVTNFN